MKNTLITDWNALPLIMTAADVASVLGLSKPCAYELFHKNAFPAIRISDRRLIVSRDSFRAWLNEQEKNPLN
jgi:predicted DNA-binding transcriptional regulator AlpA